MNYLKIDFTKGEDGLIPVIIQDAETGVVLMLGYMNEVAYRKTCDEGLVTFYSRSRKSLWTKGETSTNFLIVKDILLDCDADTLLIKAAPTGPVCHTGAATCFNENNEVNFINKLEGIIADRKQNQSEKSYTTSLFKNGIPAIAQKVGEEAVEVVIEAMRNENERFKEEAADLLFHYLVLLQAKGFTLKDIVHTLATRHEKK